VTIRHATAADRPRVLELVDHFLAATQYGTLLGLPHCGPDLFDLALTVGVIFLADVDAELIGMLALLALGHPLTGQPYAEELAWWVEPAHRIGLAGPKLLRAGEEWATTRGCFCIKMTAPHGSTVGAFYERRGYEPIESSYAKKLIAV
jgi:GNAT superfamily N-acetyltransferase